MPRRLCIERVFDSLDGVFGEVIERVGEAGDQELLAELADIEDRRRTDAAREAALLAELESRKVYRADDHATMYGLLRSRLHWSDRECGERMRLARFVADHPDLGEALSEAWVSVANAGELARVGSAAARAGVGHPAIERELGALARLAERREHDDFRLHTGEWERRINRAETDAVSKSAHDRRSAHVHVGAAGGELVAEFGSADAIEIAEIFSAYVDAEWRSDRDAAVEAFGDGATPSTFARTGAQRRADALKQIFVDAVSTPPGARAPEPTVNIHVDHATFVDVLTEAAVLPERACDPFDDPTPHVADRMCRTETGHPLDHDEVLRILLDGHVRMVIRDDEGVPIRWGRRRRLFGGAARDAVRSMSTRCTHPGCRNHVKRTETDHTVDWSRGGLTDPANGNPRCRRHNNAKNRGFTVWRDPEGVWHTYRPDGTEVG